jgi:hypothetical protein
MRAEEQKCKLWNGSYARELPIQMIALGLVKLARR